jgi:hypothetical protein
MNLLNKCDLKIDWCSVEASKKACELWHYADSFPSGKTAKFGVWEDNKFVGTVIFGSGANKNMSSSIELQTTEVCELVRVALAKHKTPVSRILSICMKMIVKKYPGLKAIVSYADPNAGHHGGIYQAGNWIYFGKTAPVDYYRSPTGQIFHWRKVRLMTAAGKGKNLTKFYLPGKHKYVMPLNHQLRIKWSKQFADLEKPQKVDKADILDFAIEVGEYSSPE